MGDHIYVVARGEYSDYSVLCACPSRKDAEAIAAKGNADEDVYGELRVERLPVYDASVQQAHVLNMTVTIWDDGRATAEHTVVRPEWPFDILNEDELLPVVWRWVRAPTHDGKGGRLDVRGTDHERVRRVFSDRRAAIMADPALRAKRERRGRVTERAIAKARGERETTA